ncbi:L-tyrosine/L-tryptophan isonitrile synthase family protein [Legionella sp. CNM-1927-20]|uniref:L-tyrosine/L-tryptophan isonitrile synthase family protein n=1 Tax=Legionella sp. CNM-1927-20 TaxID=3422221 RepID=UPI00403AEF69
MQRIAEKILALLLKQKRQVKPYALYCQGDYCSNCQEPHIAKVSQAIKMEQPLTLILPAFPAKSANRQKTISSHPDLGEIMGLKNLNQLCHEIKQLHAPGVELIICSDGRVFNDLVLVTDADVDIYQQEVKLIITENKLTYLSTFSLDDVYTHCSYETMRERLINEFGEPLASLKKRVLANEILLYQFNGIHRFIIEDQLYLRRDISKNQIRKEAKQVAYEVLRRSNAWSNLLANHFPYAVRLSIHPQPCGSEKLGIQFLPSTNCWATPWHNVLLKNRHSWQLIKRAEAERLGATLNHDHYVLEAS